MSREYILDSDSDLGRSQLGHLETLLDRHTTGFLEETGIRPGQRCLDLGAGGGSITRWLAERTGPEGKVVSVDLDTGPLAAEQPGVEVLCHDLNDGVPPGGPFDVIHARLLLMHLSRRVEILDALVGALAPGGWLVVGDFCGPPQRVLASPGEADTRLFYRVQELAHAIVGRSGISYDWAHEAGGHMSDAGLEDVHSLAVSQTTAGGTPGCLLSRNYVMQAEPLLLEGGLTEDELSRYRELLLDSQFRAWFYEFVSTRGRKPSSPGTR